MNFNQAKKTFEHILNNMSKESRTDFLMWLTDYLQNSEKINDLSIQSTNEDMILESIRDEIQEILPVTATTNTETILVPKVGPNADCDPDITVHVDAFLYDEKGIDHLVDQGKLNRNFCTRCGSQDVQPLNFISHSTSIKQIKYIFQYLLPDLSNKTILDIGSRTGGVLYGAFLYSNSRKITGVEIDSSFCELQRTIIDKYNMNDRIQVIEDDIFNQGQLASESDIIVFHNVFDFFLPISDQERMWRFVRNTFRRKGTIIISIPSLEDMVSHLQTDIDLDTWVTCLNDPDLLNLANIHLYGSVDNEDSDLADLFMYQVIG
ncbi:uncharacterized protein LOC126809738 [Patella vulgata]|uniref:uncharacterized protein LOC126809738 n=1 Tax=Patella vulgata TaxID=6465 RepID=UPI0024A7F8AF|nr:uncharacterized protein LOC126809738 [Patella vulgata]